VETVSINSWSHFVEVADRFDVGPIESFAYAFRGQADATWPLTPRLLRHIRDTGLSEAEALSTERKALAEFRSQAHLHVSTNILSSTTDTLSWWTLMQHHGVPTRLLDWTGSIYIAAYFAVSSELPVDGAVWVLHSNALHTGVDKLHGPKASNVPRNEALIAEQFLKEGMPRTLTIAGRQSKSDRMAIQQGVFTVSRSVLGDHGEIIGQTVANPADTTHFAKLVIPSNLKLTFLRKLRSVNISGGPLFPGLDGLARSVAELVMCGGK
jgi:hypothetical protein